MAGPSLLAYSAVFAQLAPPLAALARRVRDRARIGIVIWCLVLFAADAGSYWAGTMRHTNTLWMNYLCDAVSGAVLLLTLSLWQTNSVSRLALRLLTPLYLLSNLVLVLAVEDVRNFSLVTSTLAGLLLLSLVLYTLIVRSLDERRQLTRFDWFWVCSGVALYYGCAMAVDPLSRVLLTGPISRLILLVNTRSAVDVVAMLVIARGLLCPMPSHPSGGSSLPPSSRSSSS